MITGENRRNEILKLLKEQPTPLSGTALAKAFGVSRQVIVQDIEHLEERGVGRDIIDLIGLECSLGLGVLLTPYL